jgi:hypothetical protein
MTIESLYLEGCPNHERLRERLRALLKVARVATEPTLREITTEQDAEREWFLGSPTLRVNGHDVEPAADDRIDYGMKCRTYRTPEGLTGLPADRWILAALTTPWPPRPADHPTRPDRRPTMGLGTISLAR